MWCNPKYRAYWYHKTVADTLDRWIRHEIRNLIIVMPPRHGKTELASRNLPAYILGRDPSKLIIAAAATAELAEANSRDVKRIMRSAEHTELFGNLFDSDTKDEVSVVKDTDKVFSFVQGGVYNAVGTGNNIAGRGADYIIVDDYVNNREQAESDTQRDKQWQWFLDDILTRRHYPASTLVMATRWHFDDIIGRLERGDHDEEWTVLHFPKMLEDAPAAYDIRRPGEMLLSPFSLAPWEHFAGTPAPPFDDFLQQKAVEVTYEQIQTREREAFLKRRTKNTYGVSALEQGFPVPKGGGTFEQQWITRYSSTPAQMAARVEYTLISIDASFKDTAASDNCAIVVVGRLGTNLVILDEDVGKMNFSTLKSRTLSMSERYPGATVLIEDKANGPALINELRGKIPRLRAFDPTPYGNKKTRAHSAADRYASGTILHPEPSQASFIADFEDELLKFPYSKRDDRVDAVSQAVLFIDSKRGGMQRLNSVTAGMINVFGDPSTHDPTAYP